MRPSTYFGQWLATHCGSRKFAEIGFQFFLPPSLWNYGDWEYGGPNGGWIGQWIIAGVGGSFHISDAFALTARLGNPYISFGVEFLF